MEAEAKRVLIAPAAVAVFLATDWLWVGVDFSLIALTCGATAALVLSPESRQSPWPWPDLWVIAFAASLVLSILLSGHARLSLLLSSPFIPALLIYLLLSRFVSGPRGIRLVLAGLSIGALCIAASVLLDASLQPGDPAGSIGTLAIPLLVVPNDILSRQGMVGALPVAAVLGWGVKRAYQTARRADHPERLFAAGLLGAFAAFSLASFVELTFVRYWVAIMVATLIGLTAALEQPSPPIAGV
ncbi:hypothetical protein [uncultured Thiodictyon sp.]|uniref:hypothetical protein n=1 Tax=uncultured Thiodictyon sp. TaxID=1846217 RepID=UPI0025E52E76|nr:hypothetical protein [uncultured Thiodictyon sp.]